MRHLFLSLLLAAVGLTAVAQSSLNLTPMARSVSSLDASQPVLLPDTFAICTSDFGDSIVREAQRFADAIQLATGKCVTLTTDPEGCFILLDAGSDGLRTKCGDEGYRVMMRPAYGVKVFANTPRGYYYAFQTLKKILPPSVMAGVRDTTVTRFAFPSVTINDSPRFPYRGFMLDCSRHFYTVQEIKRMLNVMSYYKMNRFHWHLTDDQGWRAEIKRYPRLTEVGSISPNTLINSMTEGKYWLNAPYGPYYYTQDDMREIVRYARERHIEVLPEIEVPGHMQAAIASYPWLSCNPQGDHTIWSNGGISSDVLNVACPQAIEFVENVLAELIDIFPYPYFHVGGDETPTSAWAANADCQALKQEMGMTDVRALQSYFTREISRFLRSRGRTPIFWNESISSAGADRDMVKETDALIMCWTGAWGAAKDAAGTLGLDCIYTPWRNWYINTAQSRDAGEPSLAGDGSNTVQVAYNEEPVDASLPAAAQEHYKGVQGTFWCEHVNEIAMVEYAAMPRLQAIAEVGWTPKAQKNWDDFRQRMNQDTTLLNYNHYQYGRHILDGYTPRQSAQAAADPAPALREGALYRIASNQGTALVDDGQSAQLRHAGELYQNDMWTAVSATTNDDHTQTITLRNAATGRSIAARATNFQQRLGYATQMGATAEPITLSYSAQNDDYTLQLAAKRIYPVPSGLVYAGSNDDQNRDANRPQGAAWTVTEVLPVHYVCTDAEGHPLGTFTQAAPAHAPFTPLPPAMKNMRAATVSPEQIATLEDETTIAVTYERDAYAVAIDCRDPQGTLIRSEEHDVPLGQSLTLARPDIEYYTAQSDNFGDLTALTPASDTTFTVTYTTEAHTGAAAVLDPVTRVEAGRAYLLYDACTTEEARRGYRNANIETNQVNRTRDITTDGLDPTHVWTLEPSGKAFKIRNMETGLYVPALANSQAVTLSATGTTFTFTLNADGTSFTVKGANGTCWDGLANGNLVGWNAPGHPIRVYPFTARPYFLLTLVEQTADGTTTFATRHALVLAGTDYTPIASRHTGYAFRGFAQGEAEALARVAADQTIHLLYDDTTPVASLRAAAPSSSVYDLQGRRVANPRAGLYIIGGRKVIVK